MNQAFTAPLVDQEGWYAVHQIFIAPSEYAYIENNKYFNGANQALGAGQAGFTSDR